MNLTRKLLSLVTATVLCVANNSSQTAHATERPLPHMPSLEQTARDFFFYHCVHEYFHGGDLDKVDVSLSLASEYLFYLSYSENAQDLIMAKAKRVAGSIKAGQHPGAQVAEGDWRKAAVLWTCLEASRTFEIPKGSE